MKYTTWLIACLLLTPGFLSGRPGVYQSQEIDETYSFENDFEGWSIRSYPSDPGLPPPVTRSQERAADGLTSLKLEVNRLSVFQGVWIEKRFDVEPNQIYDALVEYLLASRDCCRSVSSYILAGVVNKSPDPANHELSPAAQGSADNGETAIGDYKWLNESRQFTVRTDDQGALFAVVGITGAEATRTYFVDKVHIRITKRSIPCEFYSFETDLEGWTPKAMDLDFQGAPIPWSVTRVDLPFQDGHHSLEMTLDSRNGNAKVWIERGFIVEPKKKYRIQLEFGLFSQFNVPRSRIIAGPSTNPFEDASDLEPSYEETIGDLRSGLETASVCIYRQVEEERHDICRHRYLRKGADLPSF